MAELRKIEREISLVLVLVYFLRMKSVRSATLTIFEVVGVYVIGIYS